MLIYYYVNFCDDGNCGTDVNNCTYPLIKKAIGTSFNQETLPANAIIDKVQIEIEAVDKFNITYPTDTQWYCNIVIGDIAEAIMIPLTDHKQTLQFETNIWSDPALFAKDELYVQCSLMAGPYNACPYNMEVVVFYHT